MAETKNKTENVETGKEKTVQVRIPRARKDEDPFVYVSVNERTWMIKKGETVDVPECVAEVLQHREEMLDIAEQFEDSIRK